MRKLACGLVVVFAIVGLKASVDVGAASGGIADQATTDDANSSQEAGAGGRDVLGANFGPQFDTAKASPGVGPRVFMSGKWGCHSLEGDVGFALYLFHGYSERWNLVREKTTSDHYYYYEEGFPDYQWAFERKIRPDGTVPVWHRRPGSNGGEWTQFDREYVTKLPASPPAARK